VRRGAVQAVLVLLMAAMLPLAVVRTAQAATVSFATHVDTATGTNPYAVVVGDFRGSGRKDLAVINYGSSTVSVLLGNGNGTFATKVDYTTGTNPTAAAVSDLRGIGRKDLVITNYGSNTVSVLLGSGTGTFATKVDYTVGTNPESVAVGDFNGDGKPDLAVGNHGSNTVSVLLGSGTGTFAAKVDYTTGSFPQSVATADFNGDSKLDLAVANHGDATVSILLGSGTGTFAAKVDYTVGAGPFSVAVADLRGVGKLDLAVANENANTVSVLLGSGTGTFAAKVDYTVGTRPNSVAIGDLSADGKLDLAVANYASGASGTTSVLLGNGDGTFAAKTDITTGLGPDWVSTGDFNADGLLDFATANWTAGTVSVVLATQSPTITSANNTSFTVGVAGTFTVTTTGSPAPSLTETGTLPTGVTFTDNGNGTATLAGTPTSSATVGTYSLTITAHSTATPDATQPFTLTVLAGALAITVPGSASLGTVAPGNTLSAHLGAVQVNDNRFTTPANWTAKVSATSFTTGGQTASETIATTAVSYWSGGFVTQSGNGTFTAGQLTSLNAVVLSAQRTAFSHTLGSGSNFVSWNPTLVIAVPSAAVAGTYTGTITHSVA